LVYVNKGTLFASEAQLSVNCRSTTAPLVFSPGTARTLVIPADFYWAAMRFFPVRACCVLSMFFEADGEPRITNEGLRSGDPNVDPENARDCSTGRYRRGSGDAG
jgi:hypothetical protein